MRSKWLWIEEQQALAERDEERERRAAWMRNMESARFAPRVAGGGPRTFNKRPYVGQDKENEEDGTASK